MWRMLQRPEPRDYVVGSGTTHSVREFVEIAFGHLGLDWKNHVVEDPRFFRPAEVDLLQADPSLAKRELQWAPTVSFEELVRMMVDADHKRLRGES
jgi:GDPmannose 4,6-dehydratase